MKGIIYCPDCNSADTRIYTAHMVTGDVRTYMTCPVCHKVYSLTFKEIEEEDD